MGRFLAALLLAISLAALSTGQALALHDPDIIQLVTVRKYSDVSVGGDALYIVRYALLYTVLPTEPTDQAWIARITDDGGAGLLASTAPTSNNPIIDSGYAHGVFSFYFAVEPVPTGTLTISLVSDPTHAHPSTLQANSISIEDRANLTADLRALAIILEGIWVQDIIDFSTGSGKFTADGADYFNVAIPNLSVYAPDLFILGSLGVDPESLRDNVDSTYATGLRAIWDGTNFGNLMNVASAQINIPRQLLELAIVVVVLFLIGGLIFAKFKAPEPALLVASLGLVTSGVLGLGYVELVYTLAAISALVFFFMMFFKTAGA